MSRILRENRGGTEKREDWKLKGNERKVNTKTGYSCSPQQGACRLLDRRQATAHGGKEKVQEAHHQSRLFLFEMESSYVAQAGFKLAINIERLLVKDTGTAAFGAASVCGEHADVCMHIHYTKDRDSEGWTQSLVTQQKGTQ